MISSAFSYIRSTTSLNTRWTWEYSVLCLVLNGDTNITTTAFEVCYKGDHDYMQWLRKLRNIIISDKVYETLTIFVSIFFLLLSPCFLLTTSSSLASSQSSILSFSPKIKVKIHILLNLIFLRQIQSTSTLYFCICFFKKDNLKELHPVI